MLFAFLMGVHKFSENVRSVYMHSTDLLAAFGVDRVISVILGSKTNQPR